MIFDKSFIASILEDKLRNAYINERHVMEKQMGICEASYRADFGLVKTNVISGYVIRADHGGASRLAAQVDCCSQLFEQVTVVVSKHWFNVVNQVPQWCGVLMVTQNDEGEVHWVQLRAPGVSPRVDMRLAASLMWKGYLAEQLGKLEGRTPCPSLERSELADRLLQLRGADGVRQDLMAFLHWRRTAPPLTLSWCEVH